MRGPTTVISKNSQLDLKHPIGIAIAVLTFLVKMIGCEI